MDRSWLAPVVATGLVVAAAAGLWSSWRQLTPPPVRADRGVPLEEVMAGSPEPLPEDLLWHRRPIPDDRPRAPDGAPHVVVVVVNALRRDELPGWGGSREVAPHWAALAERGVVFDDLVAHGVWAKPSDIALLTGVEPLAAGLEEIGDGPDALALPENLRTLADRFAAGGWFTVGFTGNFNTNARFGFDRGFDVYRDAQLASFQERTRTRAADTVAWAVSQVTARPAGAEGRPVYLQFEWSDLHKPFRIPRSESEALDGDDELGPYRAMLHRVDDALGTLVSGLEGAGLDPARTVWLVVADHGEGLSRPPSHGRQHGRLIPPTVAVVPGLLVGGGVASGARVSGLTAHVDLPKTLLGLAGLPSDGLVGLDLGPVVRGGGRSPRALATTETTYLEAFRVAAWTPTAMCQRNLGPVAQDGFRDACFDRVGDPLHLSPVANPELEAELGAWVEGQMAARAPRPAAPETEARAEDR